MVPIGMQGNITEISEGDFTIEETVALLEHDGEKKP
jgi:vacuolar-type H+-ATPase catalytic subunit A/Vma1